MSRQIPPMPMEEDRHMMIYSQGNLEPMRPEPPSRSPSPDLPPNFVPKPPVESTSFPAANNIVSLLTRMSGGASLRDLIIVPAATWDRNNTMWEHKMTQLRKKHKKDWQDKEIELRRRYDEQYSDARYRELLLSKELKELEFAQGVENGQAFGKTWKEHQVAKVEIEKAYIEKLEENKNKLKDSESTIEELRKALAKKEAAIEALQDVIARRTEEELQRSQVQNQQPQQPSLPQQSLQQPGNPQYQMLYDNQNITAALNLQSLPQVVTALYAASQLQQQEQQQQQQALQQQQQALQLQQVLQEQQQALQQQQAFQQQQQQAFQRQQAPQEQQQRQVLNQSMALVRAGTFQNGNDGNQSRPMHQGRPHRQHAENSHHGGYRNDHCGSRGNDPRIHQGNDSRNTQGNQGHSAANERSHGNHHGRDGHHHHGGVGGTERNNRSDDEHRTNSHSQAHHTPSRDLTGDSDNFAENNMFMLDTRPDIIRNEVRESRPESRSGNRDRMPTTSPFVAAPGQTASWSTTFATPQNKSVSTREPSQSSGHPAPPQPSPGSAFGQSVFGVTGHTPTSGLPGPFGKNQAVVSKGPPPQTSTTFGQVGGNFSGFRTASTSLKERPKETSKKAKPPRTSESEDTSDVDMQEAPRDDVGHDQDTLAPPSTQKTLGASAQKVKKSAGQKRVHSPPSPPTRRICSRIEEPTQEDEYQDDSQPPRISDDDDDDGFIPPVKRKRTPRQPKTATKPPIEPTEPKGQKKGPSTKKPKKTLPAPVVMDQAQLDKDIDEQVAQYAPETNPSTPENTDTVSVVDLSGQPDPGELAEELHIASQEQNRTICATMQPGLTWSGPLYIIEKLRGGLLESLKVYDKDREVYATFVRPAAAQAVYDFFNVEPNAREARLRFKVGMRWVTDSINPLPVPLAMHIANGATRCLRVSPVSKSKTVDEIEADFTYPTHKVLKVTFEQQKSKVRRDHAGMTAVCFLEFCGIQIAIDLKTEIEEGRKPGYVNCEVSFHDDPCETKSLADLRTW